MSIENEKNFVISNRIFIGLKKNFYEFFCISHNNPTASSQNINENPVRIILSRHEESVRSHETTLKRTLIFSNGQNCSENYHYQICQSKCASVRRLFERRQIRNTTTTKVKLKDELVIPILLLRP